MFCSWLIQRSYGNRKHIRNFSTKHFEQSLFANAFSDTISVLYRVITDLDKMFSTLSQNFMKRSLGYFLQISKISGMK